MSKLDPKDRFSDRVADYVKYRPSYPASLLDILEEEVGSLEGRCVADLGSGTGIMARLLLDRGAHVFAVEPNDAMRRAAEQASSEHPRFQSIAASAERTTLEPDSVDVITAAQAFHWFEPTEAREECARILRPGGEVALIWNSRDETNAPFSLAYDAFLQRWASDGYRSASRKWDVEKDRFGGFFSDAPREHTAQNIQKVDLPGLTGGLFSTSYMPKPESTEHPVYDAIRVLFDAFQKDGFVDILYTTRLYIGSVH